MFDETEVPKEEILKQTLKDVEYRPGSPEVAAELDGQRVITVEAIKAQPGSEEAKVELNKLFDILDREIQEINDYDESSLANLQVQALIARVYLEAGDSERAEENIMDLLNSANNTKNDPRVSKFEALLQLI